MGVKQIPKTVCTCLDHFQGDPSKEEPKKSTDDHPKACAIGDGPGTPFLTFFQG